MRKGETCCVRGVHGPVRILVPGRAPVRAPRARALLCLGLAAAAAPRGAPSAALLL